MVYCDMSRQGIKHEATCHYDGCKENVGDLEEEKKKNDGFILDHEGKEFSFSSTTATEGRKKWPAFLKQKAAMAEIIKHRGPKYIDEVTILSNEPLAIGKLSTNGQLGSSQRTQDPFTTALEHMNAIEKGLKDEDTIEHYYFESETQSSFFLFSCPKDS
jgi:hypothetical protein